MSTIVPLSTAIFSKRLAVSTPRYAQIVNYAEAAFFGVNHPDNKNFECREIWSHEQRIAIYRALQEAQSEVEKTAEFPLMPTWIGPERHNLETPVVLNYGKLIQMGQLLVTDLALAHATVLTTDPATVTIVPSPITAAQIDEVHIYHPGTDIEIYPSAIEIVGGNLVISIPLVRMVAIAYENTPANGLNYSLSPAWAEVTVDVKRESLSPTSASAQFVSLGCLAGCACPAETLYDGCTHVLDAEMGIISVGTLGCACVPVDAHFVDVYYQCGLTSMTPQAEDIIVRLAHARMPDAPCGCDVLKGRWRGDQLVPEILTAERENCPYGTSVGAWAAWTYAQTIKQYRMGII